MGKKGGGDSGGGSSNNKKGGGGGAKGSKGGSGGGDAKSTQKGAQSINVRHILVIRSPPILPFSPFSYKTYMFCFT